VKQNGSFWMVCFTSAAQIFYFKTSFNFKQS
jgi:hypothetical protein